MRNRTKKRKRKGKRRKGGGITISRRTERDQVTVVPKITLDKVVKQRMAVDKTVKKLKKLKKSKSKSKMKPKKTRKTRRR